MSTQWFRRYQLQVGKDGKGLSIDNLRSAPALRVKFEITKSLQKEPNIAKFDIYNLSEQHVNALQDEYTDLIFNAGYPGSMGLLYAGNTQFVSYYHDKADTICEVICGDGDKQYRQSFVNQTFAKGTTDEQIVDYCLKQLPGITKGTLQLNSSSSLRGRTFSTMTQEALDEIALSNGCNWSIQDGVLHMIRADAMIGHDTAAVLTASTGMLEAAERTDKGISVQCLLNPKISVNSAIKLDNSAIRTKLGHQSRGGKGKKGPTLPGLEVAAPVAMNKDGIYKVFKVQHKGDTRGNDWVTEILCVGLGQAIPTTSSKGKGGAVPVPGWEAGGDEAQ